MDKVDGWTPDSLQESIRRDTCFPWNIDTAGATKNRALEPIASRREEYQGGRLSYQDGLEARGDLALEVRVR